MSNANYVTMAADKDLSRGQLQNIALGRASYMAGEIIESKQVDRLVPGMNGFYESLRKRFLGIIETMETKEDGLVQTATELMVNGASLLVMLIYFEPGPESEAQPVTKFEEKISMLSRVLGWEPLSMEDREAFVEKRKELEAALRSRIDREIIENHTENREAWKQTVSDLLEAEYSARIESYLKQVKTLTELVGIQEKLIAHLNETISAKDLKLEQVEEGIKVRE